MNGAELLQTLMEQGFTLTILPGDKLAVKPSDRLTDTLREHIRQCKAEVLAMLNPPLTPMTFWTDGRHIDPENPPVPYVNSRGELVIPFECAPHYCWWDGGQSIRATLLELGASPEIMSRYVEANTMRTRQ